MIIVEMLSPDLGTGPKAYVRLLRHRPAAVPFFSALVARLSISMAPLGLLLLVQSERGAYGVAGIVTGAFAIGIAVGSPIWGRAMDRAGQPRTLLLTSTVSSLLLAADALATVGGAGLPVLVGLAAAAGLSFPPMSAAIRSAWRVIFPDPASRRVAFALDATAVELLFVVGPLLLSAILALTGPVVAVLVAAGCMAAGGIAYCRTDAARHSHAGSANAQPSSRPVSLPNQQHVAPQAGHRSAITVPGVASVLLVMLMLSIGFGQLDTSMAGTANRILGGNDRVGILFTAIAGGSAVGGLVYGARNWALEERRALPVTVGAFAILLVGIAVAVGVEHPHLWLLLPMLFGTGLMIAPSLIMQQGLLDHLTPSNRLNEAQSMLSSVNQVGAAAGTAIAGVVIDSYGLFWSFVGAAAGVGLCCLSALAGQSRWARLMAAPVAAPADAGAE
jgi:MFS family permease